MQATIKHIPIDPYYDGHGARDSMIFCQALLSYAVARHTLYYSRTTYEDATAQQFRDLLI